MKFLTALVLGALAGLLLGYVLFGTTWKRHYENQFVLGVMDQAYVALQISQDRHDPLRISIASELPEYALRLSQDFPPSPLRDQALWMIRTYYDRNAIQFPLRIQDILEGLPSEPPAHIVQVIKELDEAAAEGGASP